MALSNDYKAWAQTYSGSQDPSVLADPNLQKTYGQMTGQNPTVAYAGADPSTLASLFQPKAVTLPNSPEAMAGMRNLQGQSVAGMGDFLNQDPQAQRGALANAMYANDASNINNAADLAQRQALEYQGGRNVLNSSATGDYYLGPMERARQTALGQASNNAFVNANTLGNQNAQTRMTALGQAFNQGTTGLQGEANVGLANTGMQQQGTEAGYGMGQQGQQYGAGLGQQNTQFGQGLAQQSRLQGQAFQNARDIASSNAVSGGIGASVGGLAQLFGPSIQRGLTTAFG